MKHSYIIVDDNHESILNTQATAMRFQNLAYMGYANNYDSALNLILEHQPSLIFLEINPSKKESNLSLNLINELHRYLTVIPKIIVISKDQSLVFRAMEYGVADYLIKPLEINAFRKAILKFEKSISQYPVSNSVVQQQNAPQQALTFSDFLRQEPIQKPIVEEKIIAEIPTAEPNHETAIDNETAEEVIHAFENEEETIVENTNEKTLDREVDENIETISEEIIDTATDSENTEENVKEVEEIESYSAENKEIVEETNSEKISTTENEISETEEENTTDDVVTILPGQKIIVEQEQPLVICVKSYGDYRYIDSRDIIYFEADNNSVDIHLKDGEMVTAFKTLKVFENVLPSNQFLRIHNSYIININEVARIHTGNSVCYIKNSTVKLPFSKSYKENIELIIHRIASGNYLEI